MLLPTIEVALLHRELQTSHEHFGSPVVARLDVGVHLVPVESSTAKVDELHIHAILGSQYVFWLQVTVNEVAVLARHECLQDLPRVVPNLAQG